jgi:hydrogenase nickel incorporation protein HypA/HybF
MHELSVTEAILNTTIKYAQKERANRVTDIYLVIGDLSSIVDDCIQFYWEILSKDTICKNSKLHFDRIPGKMKCLDCKYEYNLKGELMPCPKCASLNLKVIAGTEFNLDSIEIENDEE